MKKTRHWSEISNGADYVYTPAKGEKAIVDIRMSTYNHERYIRHAIESVLMQETQYRYRLLISDDCSTDTTPQIVREYQEKYPDRIATILWKYNNVLAGAKNNGLIAMRHCDAKYVATLEGDDYWTSPHKLEKAVSFLENHPEYVGYAHNLRIVDENERQLHGFDIDFLQYPLRNEHIYSASESLANMNQYDNHLISQMGTLVFRNIYASMDDRAWDLYMRCSANGDLKHTLCLAASGDVFVDREIMSCYRKTVKGTSYSARTGKRNMQLKNYRMWADLKTLARELYKLDLREADKATNQAIAFSEEILLRDFTAANLKIRAAVLLEDEKKQVRGRLGEIFK